MRILFLVNTFRSYAIKEFASALAKNGIEYRILDDTDLHKKFPSKNIKMWFNHDKKLKAVVDEFQPDYVYIESIFYGHSSIPHIGVPLLIYLRGDLWNEKKESRKLYPPSRRRRLVNWLKLKQRMQCFQKSTIIFTVCRYLTNIADKKYPGKTVTLHHGIDLEKWKPTSGMELKHPCVGLVQKATFVFKTQEMLVLEKALKVFPDVTFYWCGGGPHENRALDVLGKYENFIHLGLLEYPNGVRKFLTEIDIYVLASGGDMLPVSVLEAQLMQKPVIVTDVGGVPEEIQDGKTGFLVEKGNPDQIIEKIKILLDDQQKAKEMGEAGRRFVEENFNWDRIAKEFINILKLQKTYLSTESR